MPLPEKEKKICIACGASFIPVTRWQDFCTPLHRYAHSESIRLLGITFSHTKEGKEMFDEILEAKLKDLTSTAKIKKRELDKAIEEKVQEIRATTWGEWIRKNFKTQDEQDAFTKENQGTTFMSPLQKLGETYSQFLARTGEKE